MSWLFCSPFGSTMFFPSAQAIASQTSFPTFSPKKCIGPIKLPRCALPFSLVMGGMEGSPVGIPGTVACQSAAITMFSYQTVHQIPPVPFSIFSDRPFSSLMLFISSVFAQCLENRVFCFAPFFLPAVSVISQKGQKLSLPSALQASFHIRGIRCGYMQLHLQYLF